MKYEKTIIEKIISNGGFSRCKYCYKIQGNNGLGVHENACHKNPAIIKQKEELIKLKQKNDIQHLYRRIKNVH